MEGIKHVDIRENSLLARIAAYKLGVDHVALTIGRRIHLHNASKQFFLNNEQWVLHELKHVEQFRKHGFLRFILMYLIESARNGYYNNKFEVEAREAEKG